MKKGAFSLIELSIVILIIGILIAGVTQSSRLVAQMKLSSARAQSQSSPVISAKDLVVWYDSTSEKAFDSTVSEDTSSNKIATWYDVNVQSTTKTNATQATDANKPLFAIDTVTGLPMVSFNGTSQRFVLPDGTIPNGDSSYTIFIAARPLSNATFDKTILSTEATENVNFNILRYRVNTNFYNLASMAGPTTTEQGATFTADAPTVLTAQYSNGYSFANSTARTHSAYKNGVLGTTGTPGLALNSPTVNNSIGARVNSGNPGGDFYYGMIGEIIIYSRAIKTEERQAIEKYLMKKWGVKA